MPESNWACPICQAGHLQTITYVEDIVLTHIREHYGEGGSNATAQLCNDGEWRVFRDGNGNRWTEREKYNPQPSTDESMVKLNDFLASVIGDEAMGLDSACDAGACDCDTSEPPIGDLPGEERITDEAWRLVMGDRQSAYNHPASDFEATGRMWGAILTNWFRAIGITLYQGSTDQYGPRTVPDIDPRIVALMIGMVKVSRESHKHKHDNLVDLIGYALCADRIARDY